MGKSAKKSACLRRALSKDEFIRKKSYLPIKFQMVDNYEGAIDLKEILRKDGVEFVKRDDPYGRLWTVNFSAGWILREKKGQANYIELIDKHGRVRALICYSYDQFDSTILLLKRFNYHQDMEAEKKGLIVMVATDGGKEVFRTESLPKSARELANQESLNKVERAVEKWLKQNYPNWKKIDAYWDSNL
jgi:hypothetical protein